VNRPPVSNTHSHKLWLYHKANFSPSPSGIPLTMQDDSDAHIRAALFPVTRGHKGYAIAQVPAVQAD